MDAKNHAFAQKVVATQSPRWVSSNAIAADFWPFSGKASGQVKTREREFSCAQLCEIGCFQGGPDRRCSGQCSPKWLNLSIKMGSYQPCSRFRATAQIMAKTPCPRAGFSGCSAILPRDFVCIRNRTFSPRICGLRGAFAQHLRAPLFMRISLQFRVFWGRRFPQPNRGF